ncbi:nucleotidyltransferase domain-containing protein [uncultured Bacteroides sp.]|uniref:nucleotidyltransferase domain-containing protein n=1 Tax=uncultured Bacteroides sp. TaxID=162156 RepID=UPI0032B18555
MEQSQVIARIKQVAKDALPANGKLLLYGSRARGEAHCNILVKSESQPLFSHFTRMWNKIKLNWYSQLQTMCEKSDYNCTYEMTEEEVTPKI